MDNEVVINPNKQQRSVSRLSLTVASTKDVIPMIEAGAKEISNEDMYNAILSAHEANVKIVSFIEMIKSEVGKKKFEYERFSVSQEMFSSVKKCLEEDLKFALYTNDKMLREKNLSLVYDKAYKNLGELYQGKEKELEECIYKLPKTNCQRLDFK